jgi:hypothetical protein
MTHYAQMHRLLPENRRTNSAITGNLRMTFGELDRLVPKIGQYAPGQYREGEDTYFEHRVETLHTDSSNIAQR